MQHVLVEPSLRGGRDSHKAHNQYHVATHTMILVDALSLVRAPEYTGCIVLGDADDRLDEEENVCDETEDGVRGFEVRARVGDLVVFDDDEGGNEGQNGGQVQDAVDVGTLLFLFGGVCGLEEEDGLSGQEDAGGIEKLEKQRLLVENRLSNGEHGTWELYGVGGEQHERLDKDGGPDRRCQLRKKVSPCTANGRGEGGSYNPDAHLSNNCCTWLEYERS